MIRIDDTCFVQLPYFYFMAYVASSVRVSVN